jgi:pimeloyl-ACP methyl ester carboxylesterase
VTSAIVLRDGRQLAYRRYGPADGAPLLFMPGAGCGRLMTFGGAALADHQIQLISVDRPGLGASSPDPLKTRAALDDGFASGATGYARDTILAMSAWPAKLFDPGVDVRILFGADDRVHSTDLGATLANRIRGAHRDIIDGVGGALLWALPDLVLARAATDLDSG